MTALTERRSWRVGGTILFASVAALLVVFVWIYMVEFGARPDDARTYLAAGERLNAGHELYRLSPGDRPIPPEIMGNGSDAPLLSPPLVAALWRPLALLPEDIAVWGWWGAMTLLVAATLLVLARAEPLLAGLALLVVGFPLIWQLSGSNLNAIVIAGGGLAWVLARSDRALGAGVILGWLAVLKLTPVLLAAWLLSTTTGPDRRRALAGLAIGAGGAAVVALALAGIESHLAYLEVVRGAATKPTAFSVGGVLGRLGAPDPIPSFAAPALAILAVSAVVALRVRPGLTFAISSVAMVVAFAAVQVHSYALLLLAVVPFATRTSTLERRGDRQR